MSFYANKSLKTHIKSLVESFVASEGQTVFTLNNTYEIGKNRLEVTVGGIQQYSPSNFTETSTTSITFSEGLPMGTKVDVEIMQIN